MAGQITRAATSATSSLLHRLVWLRAAIPRRKRRQTEPLEPAQKRDVMVHRRCPKSRGGVLDIYSKTRRFYNTPPPEGEPCQPLDEREGCRPRVGLHKGPANIFGGATGSGLIFDSQPYAVGNAYRQSPLPHPSTKRALSAGRTWRKMMNSLRQT